MTTEQKQLMSLLIDDELSQHELDELLSLMADDTNHTFKTDLIYYQFAQDAMHGKLKTNQPYDLSGKISAALDAEPALSVSEPDKTDSKAKVIFMPDWFWKQAASLATAASIGALAMIGLMDGDKMDLPQMSQVEQPQIQQSQLAATTNGQNRWTVGETEVEDRLNDYLVDHNEYTSTTSGAFSYARVVSYGE